MVVLNVVLLRGLAMIGSNMLDASGQELSVGDKVVWVSMDGGLHITNITGFTPKMVRSGLGLANAHKIIKITTPIIKE